MRQYSSRGLGVVLMAALAGTMAQAAPNAEAGHKLFEMKCAVCHKADASGGMKLGKEVSADLQSPDLETAYHNDDAMIARAILDGKDEEGGDLAKIMPRWKGRLTPAQVDDLIAYLKTTGKT